jgi:hypothetical protein
VCFRERYLIVVRRPKVDGYFIWLILDRTHWKADLGLAASRQGKSDA